MESHSAPDRRQSHSDRRVALRTPGSGLVEIYAEAPAPVTVHAELVESSVTGFRAAHDSKALEPGLDVLYKRGSVAGKARVIWTHVLEGRRVSGFLVVKA